MDITKLQLISTFHSQLAHPGTNLLQVDAHFSRHTSHFHVSVQILTQAVA